MPLKKKYCILDCFVDEPACFGVPPFISPYPRYIYGALLDADVQNEMIEYLTIDSLRENDYVFTDDYARVFMIGGAVVPGKYLGAKIGTLAEMKKIIALNRHSFFAVGGHAARLFAAEERVAPVYNDIEKYAFSLARGCPADERRSPAEAALWAKTGAPIVKRHPSYPHIICEIETYRGCPRQRHCSFCVEGLFGAPVFRQIDEILEEIDALSAAGAARFRIGRQADILQYMTKLKEFRNSFPKPESGAVIRLFGELKKRAKSGAVRLLNIDNANPGTIANFPDESAAMLSAIAAAVTPGDTIALGIESFDPKVIVKNNLKVSAEQAFFAVKMINEVCGTPLLPGINLIHGLDAENTETFALNYRALAGIMDSGLLLKRINIRKHQPFPGTALFGKPLRITNQTKERFKFYKNKIRKEIDTAMMKRIYPVGAVLEDVMILEQRDGYSLGKRVASYSVTAKTPAPAPLKSFCEVVVTGHRERSVEAIPLPIDINALPQRGLEFIPGINKKNASDIILKRPFKNIDNFISFINSMEIIIEPEILKHCAIR